MARQLKGRSQMLKQILTYGVIAGAIVGVPMGTLAVVADGRLMLEGGMILGYTLMLVALSAVFLGVKRYRDVDRGGVIGFWRALGMALAISAVGGVIYVLAWEATLALMHNDFVDVVSRYELGKAHARGASAAEIAKMMADLQGLRDTYANPLTRVAVTFSEMLPVSVPVSFLTAGLLSIRRFMPARTAA